MHPKSLQTPGADCFYNITTKSVLLACPVYSSLVLFGLRDGGKSQGGLSRIPPRLQTALAVVFGLWESWRWNPSGDGGCTNPVFCKSSSLHLQMGVGGRAQAAVEGRQMEGSWSCPVALTGGGISGCSVSPPQLSPHLSSPSLLQPEPLVLALSGTPHGAGSHRWALGGSLDR